MSAAKENLTEKRFLFPGFCDIVRETSRKWPDITRCSGKIGDFQPVFMRFLLTYRRLVGYNANLQGLYLYTPKGGCLYAENVSAEKAAQKKGAWLQKENV